MGDMDVFHGVDAEREYLLSVDTAGTHTLHVRAADTLPWSEGVVLGTLSEVCS